MIHIMPKLVISSNTKTYLLTNTINPQVLFKHPMNPFYNLSSETTNKNITMI
jgi:hypothetical protein